MKNYYYVYCAGPMAGLTFEECNSWRVELANSLPETIKVLSPTRGKEKYLAGKLLHSGAYDDHILGKQKAIFNRDKNDVLRSDLVFANFLGAKRVSIGSMFELAWAHQANKPIVLVMEKDNIHNHVFIQEVAPWITSSFDEAVYVVQNILLD